MKVKGVKKIPYKKFLKITKFIKSNEIFYFAFSLFA